MGRLISVHDIDEFAAVKRIPDAAVSPLIVSNVRKLHEIDSPREGMIDFQSRVL